MKTLLVLVIIIILIFLFIKLYIEFDNTKMYNKSKLEEKYDFDTQNLIFLLGILVCVLKSKNGLISEEENKNIKIAIKNYIDTIASNEGVVKKRFQKLQQHILNEYQKMKRKNIPIKRYITYFSKQSNQEKEEILFKIGIFLFSYKQQKDSEKIIFEIGGYFNFSKNKIQDMINTLNNMNTENIKHQETKTYSSAYDIIGCKSNDPKEIIKKRYRTLIKKYHPDYIQSKNLDNEFIEFAKRKTQEINEAYNIIKKEKNI